MCVSYFSIVLRRHMTKAIYRRKAESEREWCRSFENPNRRDTPPPVAHLLLQGHFS